MSRCILISINDQRLQLRDKDSVILEFPVSTAANGAGETDGSECTPRGWHIVHEKIGSAVEVNSIFVGRELTGEIYSSSLKKKHPDKDWILSRILWLSGLEEGLNKSGNVDTKARYIYIHGCPDDEPVGSPNSHGCIRMQNEDVITLYNNVSVGIPVLIIEESSPKETPAMP